jgi:uncharacterized protein YajQ (UPF0234 family)
VKNSGMKVNFSLRDEKIPLEGKNSDDLQAVFKLLKTYPELNVDVQIANMKGES